MTDRFRAASVSALVLLTGVTASAAQSQGGTWPSKLAVSHAAPTVATSVARNARQARAPMIRILRPEAGAIVHGSTIRVSVLLKDFKAVHKQFRPAVPGEGHIHFYLDVKKLPRTHQYPSPVPYRSISGTTTTWTGVSPGRHTVAAQLVGNDHVPLRPPVTDRVIVTVH